MELDLEDTAVLGLDYVLVLEGLVAALEEDLVFVAHVLALLEDLLSPVYVFLIVLAGD